MRRVCVLLVWSSQTCTDPPSTTSLETCRCIILQNQGHGHNLENLFNSQQQSIKLEWKCCSTSKNKRDMMLKMQIFWILSWSHLHSTSFLHYKTDYKKTKQRCSRVNLCDDKRAKLFSLGLYLYMKVLLQNLLRIFVTENINLVCVFNWTDSMSKCGDKK